MPNRTYILGFNDAGSFSAVNAITIVVGASWGNVTLPLTPLVFTRENLAGLYDIEAYFPGSGRPNNEYCYEDIYSNFTFEDRRRFWGEPVIPISKRVHGVNLGGNLGGAGVFNAVSDLLEMIARPLLRNILTLIAGTSLTSLTRTVSTDSLIRGCNGVDTYNIPSNTFSPERSNVCYIQAGIGCLVSGAVSIMIIGDFAPIGDYLPSSSTTMLDAATDPLGIGRYLGDVYNNMNAFCFIGDAAAGFILPGAQIALIAS